MDLVRCAASLRDGTVTASLLVARLQAAGGKLPLTRALQEYGRLVKTRFVLGYLADETERRAIGRQQNKGESLHALHGRTFHGNHGPCVCTSSSANPQSPDLEGFLRWRHRTRTDTTISVLAPSFLTGPKSLVNMGFGPVAGREKSRYLRSSRSVGN